MSDAPSVLFAGPDKNKNLLRDNLLAHIKNTPDNGEIRWMCYYFNEPTLFDALIKASQRGIDIEIIIEANPRSPEINNACTTLFNQYPKIKVIAIESKPIWEHIGVHWHGHMHSKMYYFSGPFPHTLIGSYNPTSDKQDLKQLLIEEIGDHTISYNLLVDIVDTDIASHFLDYFQSIKEAKYSIQNRFTKINNTTYKSNLWEINFLPSRKSHPVSQFLLNNESNVEIKCAISHLKGPGILKPLIKATRQGSKVSLILDSTKRRITPKLLLKISRYKIKYHQIRNQNHALMHNKFIIYKSDKKHCVLFGSYNWSIRSWCLNHEIIVCSHDKYIINAFEQRWKEIIATN